MKFLSSVLQLLLLWTTVVAVISDCGCGSGLPNDMSPLDGRPPGWKRGQPPVFPDPKKPKSKKKSKSAKKKPIKESPTRGPGEFHKLNDDLQDMLKSLNDEL